MLRSDSSFQERPVVNTSSRRTVEAQADAQRSSMSVPRLVTAKQPRLYLNMGTDGAMDLTGAGRAPAEDNTMRAKKKLDLRALTTLTVMMSFIVIAISGTILYLSPKGRVANWTGWKA